MQMACNDISRDCAICTCNAVLPCVSPLKTADVDVCVCPSMATQSQSSGTLVKSTGNVEEVAEGLGVVAEAAC